MPGPTNAPGPEAALGSAINLCRGTLPPSYGAVHLVPGLEQAKGLLSPRTAAMHADIRAAVLEHFGGTMPEDLDELRDRLCIAVSAAYYAAPRTVGAIDRNVSLRVAS